VRRRIRRRRKRRRRRRRPKKDNNNKIKEEENRIYKEHDNDFEEGFFTVIMNDDFYSASHFDLFMTHDSDKDEYQNNQEAYALLNLIDDAVYKIKNKNKKL